MRILILLLVFLAAPAFAVSVYKCKGPNGEVEFSNTPCPSAPANPYTTYVPEQERPPEVMDSPAESVAVAGSPPQRQSQDVADVRAYGCESQGKEWIQATPCPSTTTKMTSAPVSGVTAIDGQHFSGSASVRETHAVRQTELSKDALCTKLKGNPAMSMRGMGSSDSSYERNKLRQANGC